MTIRKLYFFKKKRQFRLDIVMSYIFIFKFNEEETKINRPSRWKGRFRV